MLRAFSFQRISLKTPPRLNITEKLVKLNRKEYIRRLNPFEKVWYYLYTHKKKNIFFGMILGIAGHYDLHGKIYRGLTVVTPAERARRMIMKKKQNLNERYCREPETSLKEEAGKQLVEFFLECDRELEKGLPRGLLVDIAEELKWVGEKDKYIGGFLWESGYRKEPKQKKSGMSLEQFLGFFENMQEKTGIAEDQLLPAFFEAATGKIAALKEKELAKRSKTTEKEVESREKARQAFVQAGKPLNPELEELEVQQEKLLETFRALWEKEPKSATDVRRLVAMEQTFINKEKLRSKIYS